MLCVCLFARRRGKSPKMCTLSGRVRFKKDVFRNHVCVLINVTDGRPAPTKARCGGAGIRNWPTFSTVTRRSLKVRRPTSRGSEVPIDCN